MSWVSGPRGWDAPAVADLLRDLLKVVDQRAEELSELDAVAGDGDLGVTMKLGMKAAVDSLPSPMHSADIGTVLISAGRAFGSHAPSTLGTLLATGIRRAGQAVQGRETVTLADAVTMLGAAIEAMEMRGGAKPGDKTLLDVLVPFERALAAELARGADDREAVSHALTTAKAGLESTRAMVPRAGRSRWLTGRSTGSLDAGAAAVYLLVEAASKQFLTGSHESSV